MHKTIPTDSQPIYEILGSRRTGRPINRCPVEDVTPRGPGYCIGRFFVPRARFGACTGRENSQGGRKESSFDRQRCNIHKSPDVDIGRRRRRRRRRSSLGFPYSFAFWDKRCPVCPTSAPLSTMPTTLTRILILGTLLGSILLLSDTDDHA